MGKWLIVNGVRVKGKIVVRKRLSLRTIPLARSLPDNRISIRSAKAELLDNRLPLSASGSRVILPTLVGAKHFPNK